MEFRIFLLYSNIMFVNATNIYNCCATEQQQKLCNTKLFHSDENSHEQFAITSGRVSS